MCVLGMVTGLMHLAFRYIGVSSSIQDVPGSNLGQTAAVLKVSVVSFSPFTQTLTEENLHYTTTVFVRQFPGHEYSVILPFKQLAEWGC